MSTVKVDTIESVTTNGTLTLTPNGTGGLVTDHWTWPLVDGSADQVLKTDGGGNLDFVDVGLTFGTEASTSSGTSVSFTSLPSGITTLYIMFNDVSLDGTDSLQVQLGDSGGIETSGYDSNYGNVANGATGEAANLTSGFGIDQADDANRQQNGIMTLLLMDSSNFHWIATYTGAMSTNRVAVSGGEKALSAELTQITIKPTGANNFDGGAINIAYS